MSFIVVVEAAGGYYPLSWVFCDIFFVSGFQVIPYEKQKTPILPRNECLISEAFVGRLSLYHDQSAIHPQTLARDKARQVRSEK